MGHGQSCDRSPTRASPKLIVCSALLCPESFPHFFFSPSAISVVRSISLCDLLATVRLISTSSSTRPSDLFFSSVARPETDFAIVPPTLPASSTLFDSGSTNTPRLLVHDTVSHPNNRYNVDLRNQRYWLDIGSILGRRVVPPSGVRSCENPTFAAWRIVFRVLNFNS